jgi:heme exporter protein D
MDIAEFFNMGGYAAYVWPSYALALILMVANVLSAVFSGKQVKRAIHRQINIRKKQNDAET